MIQESVIEFKLPALGENIEQGDLVRLMIAPGATVSEGQAVMELETDKAVVEVPSSVSGKVKEILVKEGEKIKVGQVIFTVDNHAGPRWPRPRLVVLHLKGLHLRFRASGFCASGFYRAAASNVHRLNRQRR